MGPGPGTGAFLFLGGGEGDRGALPTSVKMSAIRSSSFATLTGFLYGLASTGRGGGSGFFVFAGFRGSAFSLAFDEAPPCFLPFLFRRSVVVLRSRVQTRGNQSVVSHLGLSVHSHPRRQGRL